MEILAFGIQELAQPAGIINLVLLELSGGFSLAGVRGPESR
jgi:hypothetical protein